MEFEWPWQYNFPPFFTIQPNEETKKKQLEAWQRLILDYCRFQKICVLDLAKALNSPLFQNKAISRQLSAEAAVTVLETLREKGRIEWTDKLKNQFLVYWRSPEEWGKLIYQWAAERGMTNTVCTFYELASGDDTKDQDFHGLDEMLLVKSLRTLEVQQKAEIMSFDGNSGVKFF